VSHDARKDVKVTADIGSGHPYSDITEVAGIRRLHDVTAATY